jgi:hypothetical protein
VSRSALVLGVAAAAGLGLLATNPSEEEFEPFAADQLTRLVREELCSDGGLPMLARLVVRDCPRLIQSQHNLFGKLALAAAKMEPPKEVQLKDPKNWTIVGKPMPRLT